MKSRYNGSNAGIEDLVPDQVSDLIQMNKRLQLEMLERDLVEEQVSRKSKLLEAINQVLNQMVANRSEHSLAATLFACRTRADRQSFRLYRRKFRRDAGGSWPWHPIRTGSGLPPPRPYPVFR